MRMILLYLDQVDDENFLTALVTERDFVGRDSLRIAVELELLDLVRAPKFQAIIKRQYYSDFDQSGSLFQMSTTYQIVFGTNNLIADIEDDYRFYKKRDISQTLQSTWLYEIYKSSMNSKIVGQGIVIVIFFIIQTIEAENVIYEWSIISK